jgi:hypothetical protein
VVVYWIAVGAFWFGVFMGFQAFPFHSKAVRALMVPAAMVVLSASFVRGIWVSWRTWRIGMLVKVVLPILLVCIAAVISVGIFMEITRKAQLAADQGTIGVLRRAIAMYREDHGRFPADKATVEALVHPPPRWACRRQNWTYEATAAKATLAVTDARAC